MKSTVRSNAPEGLLRIKRGINPNSSSVGSDIPAFLFSAAAMTVFGAVAIQVHDLIRGAFGRREQEPKAKNVGDAS